MKKKKTFNLLCCLFWMILFSKIFAVIEISHSLSLRALLIFLIQPLPAHGSFATFPGLGWVLHKLTDSLINTSDELMHLELIYLIVETLHNGFRDD